MKQYPRIGRIVKTMEYLSSLAIKNEDVWVIMKGINSQVHSAQHLMNQSAFHVYGLLMNDRIHVCVWEEE